MSIIDLSKEYFVSREKKRPCVTSAASMIDKSSMIDKASMIDKWKLICCPKKREFSLYIRQHLLLWSLFHPLTSAIKSLEYSFSSPTNTLGKWNDFS